MNIIVVPNEELLITAQINQTSESERSINGTLNNGVQYSSSRCYHILIEIIKTGGKNRFTCWYFEVRSMNCVGLNGSL
jgi:hypothetical protein